MMEDIYYKKRRSVQGGKSRDETKMEKEETKVRHRHRHTSQSVTQTR